MNIWYQVYDLVQHHKLGFLDSPWYTVHVLHDVSRKWVQER